MLSVIIPYVNEYPQLLWTIRSIAEELTGVEFEIIVINNYCDQVKQTGFKEDDGFKVVEGSAPGHSWLKSLHYKDKLSHWQSKNLGVKHSTGEFLLFVDAHVLPSRGSISDMYDFYQNKWQTLNGTIHLPLTYKILEWRRLMYSLIAEPEIGKYYYKFSPINDNGLKNGEKIFKPGSKVGVFETPVMSTCGCMMHRSIYDKIGGWPEELGIYGGGEPFINFTLSVMGMRKWIWTNGTLYHHGEKRGYSWNHDDWLRNDLISSYCYGGGSLIKRKWPHVKGRPEAKKKIWDSVMGIPSIKTHRELIKSEQVMSIDEWVKPWIQT